MRDVNWSRKMWNELLYVNTLTKYWFNMYDCKLQYVRKDNYLMLCKKLFPLLLILFNFQHSTPGYHNITSFTGEMTKSDGITNADVSFVLVMMLCLYSWSLAIVKGTMAGWTKLGQLLCLNLNKNCQKHISKLKKMLSD